MCENRGMDQPLDRGKLRRKMQKLLSQRSRQWTEADLQALAKDLVGSPSAPTTEPVILPDPLSAVSSSESELHPAAKYLRKIGFGSLFLGMARLIPPSLFWWQTGFIWAAGLVFVCDI